MRTGRIFHALGLHMHQPPGNLRLLIDSNPWETEQIIRCYDRVPRYAREYADVGRLHVGFSGVLLEQFRDPEMVDRYRRFVDIPAMLENYAEADNIELIGMGYYHPIFPLIPQEDWEEQLLSGREIMQEIFGRAPKGFWPPEMAFCMEMIPALVKAGYEYVVVDGVHVQPQNSDKTVDVFQPYRASFEGSAITVIPRNRDISNAQESGLDPGWFFNEAAHKVAESPRPEADRLVTTWSDGENGGWFRQMHEASGFFGHFFAPYMEAVRGGESPVQPTAISEYLDAHSPSEEAFVRTGAWNVGSTSGFDLSQWAGSDSQKQAVERVRAISARYWGLKNRESKLSARGKQSLAKARDLILEGETSCFLFWGDAWVPELYKRTTPAERYLAEAENESTEPCSDN
ncbi:polysaccharide deacetylase family protein [Methylohalobius crimeensis]|uniref:glycoside hydrolase family 57 n=1 Tax=Methylohalobius crimeensis TaxID=244365 RepID=UPI0003B421A1|nr:glycoside hydrolase family 57 [Methylohalobius crimeensis]